MFSKQEFVCSLSSKYLEIAKIELGETETRRDQALEQLKEWIQKHPNIQKFAVHPTYFVAFLRKQKFNVPKTCEAFETYLTYSQFFPQWLANIDIMSPDIQELITNGYTYLLPNRDQLDRQVCMIVVKNFNCKKYNFDQLVRVSVAVFLYMTSIEINQVTGINCVVVCDSISLNYLKLFNVYNIIHSLRELWYGTGIRMKGFYFVDLPAIAMTTIEVIKKVATQKMRNRFHTVRMSDLKDHFDVSILPKEYGGEVLEVDMIEEFKVNFNKKRDLILETTNAHITNFESLKLHNKNYAIPASFRTLGID